MVDIPYKKLFNGSLMDLNQVQRIGISAAYEGAKILRKHFGKLGKVDKKGEIDLITIADTESEAAIIETIKSKYPHHTIIAEESGQISGEQSARWFIDPLDGTTNYAHGLGFFSVSIAFAEKDEILFGIVLNPLNAELFTAIKGQGAKLNGESICVSENNSVSESLLVTGFPYNFKDHFETILLRFSNCLRAAQAVRRLGSAALDLCFVACGRIDGFWEQNLNPWDTAAGVLIASEAGAVISDFSNQPYNISKKELLTTNGKIHKEMISLLQTGINI